MNPVPVPVPVPVRPQILILNFEPIKLLRLLAHLHLIPEGDPEFLHIILFKSF